MYVWKSKSIISGTVSVRTQSSHVEVKDWNRCCIASAYMGYAHYNLDQRGFRKPYTSRFDLVCFSKKAFSIVTMVTKVLLYCGYLFVVVSVQKLLIELFTAYICMINQSKTKKTQVLMVDVSSEVQQGFHCNR